LSNPDWLARVREGYYDDPVAVKLLKDLSDNPSAVSSFTLHDGILRHKGRVWLGNNTFAQQHVIQAMHTSLVGGILESRLHITESSSCLLGLE